MRQHLSDSTVASTDLWLVTMNPVQKAVSVGVAVEAVLLGCFALGGFGPCGPSNPLGFIGMLAHLFPGFAVAALMSTVFEAPEVLATTIIVVVQAVFWGGLAYLHYRPKAVPQ